MKLLGIACLVATATLSFGQAVKFRVILGGKPMGTAQLTQRLRPDGSKQVLLSMELKNGENVVQLRSESVYAKNGMPIRKFQETQAPAQRFRRSRVVTFDAKGANLVEDFNGQRKTRSFPLAEAADRAAASEFWFLRDQPKPGTSIKHYVFDLETLEWRMTTATYVGLVDLTVGNRKMKVHKATIDRGSAYFDQEGLPVQLELENGTMERIES